MQVLKRAVQVDVLDELDRVPRRGANDPAEPVLADLHRHGRLHRPHVMLHQNIWTAAPVWGS